MGQDQPGKELGGSTVERVVVSFDPGVVRAGRLVAHDGHWLEADFARRQRQTLAVGACVRVGIHYGDGHPTPSLPATVTERSERGSARRYRFFLHRGARDVHRQILHDHPAPKSGPVPVELHFGQLRLVAKLTNWIANGIQLQVTREVEAKLCSTDALELAFQPPDAHSEGRLIGWIERRVLDGDHVNFDFRIDDHLSDDGASQRARLRTILAGAVADPTRST